MFETLPESTENCIGFKVSGKVTAQDYEDLVPKLDEAIARYGKINLLVVFGDFEGWDGLDAAKADFAFGTHGYRQVEKAAFVGDKKWQEWMVKIMAPFTRHTEERFFGPDEMEAAWQWVLGQ
ncbi:MAG TPA: STAS/SEC14 domain-containing protein [Anaerolineae bacterium]|nr:STAS/SEC14 domain-containing protein [Anaerolineae bacterium]